MNYSYNSWGKILQISGSGKDGIGVQNPFRYRGYYYDGEAELYYVGSRYYDPTTGRFINAETTDVLSLEHHNMSQYNLFAYCNNNPINDFDDSGQLSFLAKIAIGVVAIGIGAAITFATGGAAAPALIAGVKAACIAGAISAGTSASVTAVKSVVAGDSVKTVLKKSTNSAINGFADGFMAGGIMAGASQAVSGGFKIAANAGVNTGKNGGIQLAKNVKVLSPNSKLNTFDPGGTLLKIGTKVSNVRLDVGVRSLLHINVQFAKNIHVPVGTIGSGLYGGLKKWIK